MVKIEDIVGRMQDFPTLPTIYTQLMDVMANSRSTVQDLADVILKDQASTAKILKVVNSPVYAIQSQVNNISQAIMYLGLKEVKNIVLALSVMDVFSKVDSDIEFSIPDLWKHSIAVGIISKVLGMHFGERNTEDHFVSGIIHDIGILFFLKYYPEQYQIVIKKTLEHRKSLGEMERRGFGISHSMVGEIIAKNWQLPESLQSVIRYHHVGIVEGKTDRLCIYVHLANVIAKLMGMDYFQDTIIQPPNFAIWNVLQVGDKKFGELYKTIKDTYNQFITILKLN